VEAHFRNALIPIITGFPAAFIGAFFTGSLLIETLFSLDGMGLLSYESIIRRDYPVVLGTLYLFTLIGLFTKLISDLSYVWVDPRVDSTNPPEAASGRLPPRGRLLRTGKARSAAALVKSRMYRTLLRGGRGGVSAQQAGVLQPGAVLLAGGAEPVCRADLERPATAGTVRRRLLLPHGQGLQRENLWR
jgi:hypothetical protein